VIPPVLTADLVSEIRHGRDGLRLRIDVTVQAANVSQAVTVAWDALEAATDEVGGFDLAGAATEAGPAPLVPSTRLGLATAAAAPGGAGFCFRRRVPG